MSSEDVTRRPGRPTKLLDDNVLEELLDAITKGATHKAAAESAGISESTFYAWTARGRAAQELTEDDGTTPDSEKPFLEFLEAVTRAHARGQIVHLSRIDRAAEGGYVTKSRTKRYRDPVHGVVEEREDDVADGDWRASAWLLERRHPDGFGKQATVPVELSGPDGGPVEVGATDIAALAARVTSQAAMLREAYEAGWPNGEGVPLSGPLPQGSDL